MLGRYCQRLAEAEAISLVRARLPGAALALVGDKQRGLAGLAHQIRKGAVVGEDAGAGIDHEQDEIGIGQRGLRLRPHAPGQSLGGCVFEAGGIDDAKGQIAEVRHGLAPVTGDARPVVHERDTPADQPVEQRRFADVRPAHDGDGETHGR